ncbi:MAG: S-methyl-5-thioribose-1-phosphate isomerase [Clostridiales Family XIII bacterium]|jgi:methylthioribose-1-phosphate isomerase|nr:S-methyl-5-thioribose-1-phosphate isomerase [Clostridiales Family XIII bacterium]
MKSTSINEIKTVRLDDAGDAAVIIDQTLLPGDIRELRLRTPEDFYDAIRSLAVRGAPAIGIAAAYGVYLAVKHLDTDSYDEFRSAFIAHHEYLNASRPTAVNLKWALDRMKKVLDKNAGKPIDEIKALLLRESMEIAREDEEMCEAIGRHALTLLHPGMGVLTHCNAGRLATGGIGTATAGIYLAERAGYGLRIYCDETRPLLQGARLTAFELAASGADTTLICDNMASAIMSEGLIDIVFTGCDRVAANGDSANKIGTLSVAVNARHYGIPFYICAPSSTIDPACPSGQNIPIEERSEYEVTSMWYEKPMAPENIKVRNPAFDVTPANLITGIITENGIVAAPYEENLSKLVQEK